VNSTGPFGLILTLVPSLIIAAAYTATAWFVHRRWRLLGLVILWACCSAAYGYVSFGAVCPLAFTCAVPASEAAYLKHVGLFYALVGAMGFAGPTAVVLRYSDLLQAIACGRWVSSRTLATFAGWILAWVIVPKPFSCEGLPNKRLKLAARVGY